MAPQVWRDLARSHPPYQRRTPDNRGQRLGLPKRGETATWVGVSSEFW